MKGGQGGEQGDGNAYALLWILAIIFVVCGLVWYFWGEHLKMAFIYLKKYELQAVMWFVNDADTQLAMRGIRMVTPDNLTMDYADKISAYIGEKIRYPIAFLLGIMAIFVLRAHAGIRFNRAHTMDSLAQQEKNNWPQIAPVVEIDLLAEDINQGPWAMSMNPLQFSKHYRLLHVQMVLDPKAPWKKEGIPQATLVRARAEQVFATQLGPAWSGIDNLPPHTKALYAAFAARIEHDTDGCLEYLAKLAKSASKGEMDYSMTETLLKKYRDSKAIVLSQTKHAYVSTMMATMLELARSDGVLASANFLWIKPIDRRLWYILNSVGRQVAVPEVGGIFAHWLAEKQMGRSLTVPMIEEAVNALEVAINNVIYTLDDNEVIEGSAPSQEEV